MANKNHRIIKNLIAAIVVFFLIILVLQIILGLVTRHNKYVVVPDLSTMTVEEAALTAQTFGLNVEVEDSIYALKQPRGTVFSQLPKAGSEVKEGRTIDLTINAFGVKKVKMPSLVGCSLKQARTELAARGLVMGRIIYQADIATNVVLHQQIKGREVKPGTQVAAGSVVNLVCGLNYENAQVYVPNVVGLDYNTAISLVLDNSLNIGNTKFDRRVRSYSDSLACVVAEQSPLPDATTVLMGTNVNLTFKLKK